MEKTLVALFNDAEEADHAAHELLRAGAVQTSIKVCEGTVLRAATASSAASAPFNGFATVRRENDGLSRFDHVSLDASLLGKLENFFSRLFQRARTDIQPATPSGRVVMLDAVSELHASRLEEVLRECGAQRIEWRTSPAILQHRPVPLQTKRMPASVQALALPGTLSDFPEDPYGDHRRY